jgi:hypothetical protein
VVEVEAADGHESRLGYLETPRVPSSELRIRLDAVVECWGCWTLKAEW